MRAPRFAVVAALLLLAGCGGTSAVQQRPSTTDSAAPSASPVSAVPAGRVDRIPVKAPRAMVVSQDGRRLFVSSGGFDVPAGAWSVDTSTGSTGRFAAVAGFTPRQLAIDADGARLYLSLVPSTSSQHGGRVVVMDTGTMTVRATSADLGDRIPGGVAVSPDGASVYAASNDGQSGCVLKRLDPATLTERSSIAVGRYCDGPLGMSPDGRTLYAVVGDPKAAASGPSAAWSLVVIDTASGVVSRRLPVADGDAVYGLAVTSEGSRVLAVTASGGSSVVSVIDPAAGTVTASGPMARGCGLAVDPRGRLAFVGGVAPTGGPGLLVLDVATLKPVATLPAATFITQVAANPVDGTVYTDGTGGDAVEVFR
jgi:DNA-binding beta-propeller fold protein YncE